MSLSKLCIKRITGDLISFEKHNPTFFDVYPNKDNILEINFIMYGRPDTPYYGGRYIGKIIHNPEYPLKAPDYYVLTPNGRFDINKKICLTNSSFHQDEWAPTWNLVSMLEGFDSVWHSNIKEDLIGIGHLRDTPNDIIIELKNRSIEYNNHHYYELYNSFPKIKLNYNPYTL
jgi:ubiquitin-conjugating enzyme E2 J2